MQKVSMFKETAKNLESYDPLEASYIERIGMYIKEQEEAYSKEALERFQAEIQNGKPSPALKLWLGPEEEEKEDPVVTFTFNENTTPEQRILLFNLLYSVCSTYQMKWTNNQLIAYKTTQFIVGYDKHEPLTEIHDKVLHLDCDYGSHPFDLCYTSYFAIHEALAFVQRKAPGLGEALTYSINGGSTVRHST